MECTTSRLLSSLQMKLLWLFLLSAALCQCSQSHRYCLVAVRSLCWLLPKNVGQWCCIPIQTFKKKITWASTEHSSLRGFLSFFPVSFLMSSSQKCLPSSNKSVSIGTTTAGASTTSDCNAEKTQKWRHKDRVCHLQGTRRKWKPREVCGCPTLKWMWIIKRAVCVRACVRAGLTRQPYPPDD